MGEWCDQVSKMPHHKKSCHTSMSMTDISITNHNFNLNIKTTSNIFHINKNINIKLTKYI